eukprot:gene9714-20196_t
MHESNVPFPQDMNTNFPSKRVFIVFIHLLVYVYGGLSTVHHNSCEDFLTILDLNDYHSGDTGRFVGAVAMHERAIVMSNVMTVLNSSMTVFVRKEYSLHGYEYPRLQISYFDSDRELARCGFEQLLLLINRWDEDKWYRVSNILRLCLCYRYGRTYLDYGAHPLDLTSSNVYMRNFVVTPVWHDIGSALEVSNQAFCLPRRALRDLIERLIKRITFGRNKYNRDELGSSMFPKILWNQYRLRLYSANHPEEPYLTQIIRSTNKYGHKLFLESQYIRTAWGEHYLDMMTALRHSLLLEGGGGGGNTTTFTTPASLVVSSHTLTVERLTPRTRTDTDTILEESQSQSQSSNSSHQHIHSHSLPRVHNDNDSSISVLSVTLGDLLHKDP